MTMTDGVLQLRPWAPVEAWVPSGFELDAEGVRTTDSTPKLIAGACWVSAHTRAIDTAEGEPDAWGVLIEWIDRDGRRQRRAFPASRLQDPRGQLAGELAGMGLHVIPTQRARLMEYLASWQPPQRVQSVRRLGWHQADDGPPIFVLPPNRVLGAREASPDRPGAPPRLIYQPESLSPSSASIRPGGSPDSWRREVAQVATEHPMALFALCVGLSGPLLDIAGVPSGGFNLFGRSSRGKTTALQLAASVWGRAAEPGAADASFILTWNQTGNAFEATAAAHNDTLLVLDELGQCDPFSLEKVTYMLSGGVGKQRLNKAAELRAARTWRTVLLSSGEVSVAERLGEIGRAPKAGQLVRLIDVPVERGLFRVEGADGAALSNRLKKACGQHFGHAGPGLIRHLQVRLDEDPGFGRRCLAEIQRRKGRLEEALRTGGSMESHHRRALERFALVSLAGELAVDAGVFGDARELRSRIEDAVHGAARAWLGSSAAKSEGRKALDRLVHTITTRPGSFPEAQYGDSQRGGAPVLGYRWQKDRGGEVLYVLTRGQLEEVCSPYAVEDLLSHAARTGLLYTEPGRNTVKPTIGRTRGQRMYAFRAARLLGESPDGED
ncbi:MAG: DUF927 domain-containing protein [Pseudomonadales bacterium]|jgi:uncharacterized protein (DUF927 family)|nr:DUF927 domain-containing protein [Pseudomonadales bacterium]